MKIHQITINKGTQFCMNNTKLCSELFSNHFYDNTLMLHEFAKGATVEFAVNPRSGKPVRFTYFDRMVHDALYSVYQDYLNKNPLSSGGCATNYQQILKVITGNPNESPLKADTPIRTVLRHSLLKLASTDIYIDATALQSPDAPSPFIFFGNLVQLEETAKPESDEEESEGKTKKRDDCFVISGRMPLFDYAESVGLKNGQLVYYPAKALNYPVVKTGINGYFKGLSTREDKNYKRAPLFDNMPKPEAGNVYKSTFNKKMIKHYLMHRIMVLKSGKCPENFNIIRFLATKKERKKTVVSGMIVDVFQSYYELNKKRGEKAPENAEDMLRSFAACSDAEKKKLLDEVKEFTEAQLCTWIYHGFITSAIKRKDGKEFTGVTITEPQSYEAAIYLKPKAEYENEKVYCHVESDNAAFHKLKTSRELCRKIKSGKNRTVKYMYYLSKLSGNEKDSETAMRLENGKEYTAAFFRESDDEPLCSFNFTYPNDIGRIFSV